MFEQITFQIIFQFLQTVGILVGVFYYIITIRTNQRNQELTRKAQETTLETRQAQLFMQIYNRFQDSEFTRHFNKIQSWEWKDYDDYLEKYGAENIEASTAWWSVGKVFEGIGVLVKRGLIDVAIVDDLMSGQILQYWEKVGPIIMEMRRRLNYPQAWEHVEFLYDQILPLVEEQHPELKT